jgi:hypothetical protein
MLVDSQAFRVLELHGDHVLSAVEYARAIERIAPLCDRVVAVSQDYMCEKYIFDCRERLTGVRYTVRDHQRLTIERYDAIRAALDPAIELMPVIQGYKRHEYARHIADYGDRLDPMLDPVTGKPIGRWVGVGSVCKRNGNAEKIMEILYTIHRSKPGMRLHGFGVKTTSMAHPVVRRLLYSADSMAWSYAARKQGRNGNDWREAERFTKRIYGQSLEDLPMFKGWS